MAMRGNYLNLIITISMILTLEAAKDKKCSGKEPPASLGWSLFDHSYDSINKTLNLNLSRFRDKFCINSSNLLKVELVKLSEEDIYKYKGKGHQHCRNIPVGSFFQKGSIHDNELVRFQYVRGAYFLRIRECIEDFCKVLTCTRSKRSFEPKTNEKIIGECSDGLSSLEMETMKWNEDEETCELKVSVLLPLCAPVLNYHTFTVRFVRVNLEEKCTGAEYDDYDYGGYDGVEGVRIEKTPLYPASMCNSSIASLNFREACGNSSGDPYVGFLTRSERILRNSSYCIFLRNSNPHCPCLFYGQSESLTCESSALFKKDQTQSASVAQRFLLSEPVFVSIVSLTLVVSLILLTCIVVSRRYHKRSSSSGELVVTPPSSAEKKKQPPRSLTEDDLEHISRLPSQEIVLVYFPDTQRFKDLNRKLRDWLVTLNVNDVKDIYDEKSSESVKKDPESWVRKTFGGPEKRIILVCSRLAYECLASIKQRVGSPKFTETDLHFGLLFRSIRFIEREMRGNYRNLICVRYEDLKICSRKYSSEAFNIVPGTEYVLPQHLEDVYRWIHPREPRPECWSENNPAVKEFLDAIKNYRHHDDNIFTVQFCSNNGVN